MNKNDRILIVGHGGIMEISLRQYFQSQGFRNVFSSWAGACDILNQVSVVDFFKRERPDYVFFASVRSGGIAANQKFAAEFIYSNLTGQNHVIHAAYQSAVKKLIFFAGSCVYPEECPQPIKEKYLLTGALEPTSEPYSIAKIAGIKLCQSYRRQYGFNAIAVIPATVYGPGSDTDLKTAHVMGALIGKFYRAVVNADRKVVVWGSGRPRREFLFTDDFVEACLFLMKKYNHEAFGDDALINVGCGYDISIKELAYTIKEISGFKGKIIFDRTRPDGTMKKLMDNSRITKLGWRPNVRLAEGIKKTYRWYQQK